MKIVALPRGKQCAIHGPVVNVPTDLTPVCTLLPRLPSQTQMVPMKLERKLCYKGHHMYHIRPTKVLVALQLLKLNNPLYKDVEINSDWVSNAAEDDTELWEVLSAEHYPPPPPSSPTTTITTSSQSTMVSTCKCMYVAMNLGGQPKIKVKLLCYLFINLFSVCINMIIMCTSLVYIGETMLNSLA